jgi:aspartate carbamoyltransferase catalytic subunit
MGAHVVLCGPSTLMPIVSDPRYEGLYPQVEINPDFDKAVEGANVVMALRMQLERQKCG